MNCKFKIFPLLALSRARCCSLSGIILIFVFLSGCQQEKLYRDTQVMMGTFVEVISPDSRAAGIAFGEIKRLEKLLSKYDPQSDVSRLNASGELRVSPEASLIIKKAKEFAEISFGAFDISVAPLVDLWGFTDKKFNQPQEEEIKKTLALVGAEKIILQEKDNVVKFGFPGMKIDLGGIAKGYALDCAAEKLREKGISSCLLNAGGQVYALGEKAGRPWRVAIRAVRGKNFSGYLHLKDQSAATSGDYEQFFSKNGKRFAHILDPRTGKPADSGISAVTVIAPDGLTADMLSTAIFVLGRKKGLALAKRFPGVKVRLSEN
jgi:thiamine biosynthesis lipoprotein